MGDHPAITELLRLVFDVAACETCDDASVLDDAEKAEIIVHVRDVYAAGVNEGRRRQREEFAAASLAARGWMKGRD